MHSNGTSNVEQITLKFVAKEAGVSPSTVSRVLNGTASVSPTKVSKVKHVINSLNYKPNVVAQSLARGKTKSVGVLTQWIDSPFYAEALRGVEDTLYKVGYTPLFVSGHWDQQIERSKTQMLCDRKVDGIIVIKGKMREQDLLTLSHTTPTVVVGRQIQSPELISITFDDAQGIQLLLNHLYELNHRNIAFISGPLDHPDATERFNAFRNHSKSLGLKNNTDHMIISDFQSSGGYDSINRLFSSRDPFSAVICANDQMAYGALLALNRSSLRVPNDIALVGFDDLPHSMYTTPPLTTIRQSVFEMGVLAAESLLNILNGKPAEDKTVEAQLIVRESTSCDFSTFHGKIL